LGIPPCGQLTRTLVGSYPGELCQQQAQDLLVDNDGLTRCRQYRLTLISKPLDRSSQRRKLLAHERIGGAPTGGSDREHSRARLGSTMPAHGNADCDGDASSCGDKSGEQNELDQRHDGGPDSCNSRPEGHGGDTATDQEQR
jgi:hypothetical protein